MTMCLVCKQSIPEPRVTKEEVITGTKRSIVLPGESRVYDFATRKYAWYRCPKCGREQCTVIIMEKVEKAE